ncbi:unnamed protein product [Sphenostylis stenocarpa]|uniref:Rubisco LSMT substrate-binding domain-containing protein n=1 Tax=Sphenostylis stenocarpa TaxID=92480 RepID=A0AA86VDE2_9FABA|nr:unnamed protein product [Sphenostylis stenocarpa]
MNTYTVIFDLGVGRTLHPDMAGEPAGMLVNTWVHMAWERLVRESGREDQDLLLSSSLQSILILNQRFHLKLLSKGKASEWQHFVSRYFHQLELIFCRLNSSYALLVASVERELRIAVMDTDEEYSIVLELSERDPFFDKKKKLLQNKGFSPKERIYLRSSSKPGWMSATVEVLLQIARIIQLNELELYFAEDVCTSTEFYSPRNELEALNSIVLLIDISLSSCTHLHTDILQRLRQTILDLISDLGEKNSVKGVVEKDHSCDQEERLIEWGESNGVMTQLKIAYIEGAGRGAIARKDLKVGDIALDIPVSIIISEELVHETDMHSVLVGKTDNIVGLRSLLFDKDISICYE